MLFRSLAVEGLSHRFEISSISRIRTAQRECGMLSAAETTLIVTPDHPLYDPNARAFHPAGDWLLGVRSALLSFDGECFVRTEVTSRSVFVGVRTVFDLTVASSFHTFVAEGVVVHNKKPIEPECVIPNDGGATRATENIRDVDEVPCSCLDGGPGLWICGEFGAPATCARCNR